MSELQNAAAETSLSRRRTRSIVVWTIVAVLLVVAVVQSVTITPSIHGRILDAQGRPLGGVAVAALWEVDAATLEGARADGTVRIAETVSDSKGAFSFGAARIVHAPLMPFSWRLRSDSAMPRLVIVHEQHSLRVATNDIYGLEGPGHSAGFLSIRSSSLENAMVQLSPLPNSRDADAVQQYPHALRMASRDIEHANFQCARSVFCQGQPLTQIKQAITQAQQHFDRNAN